MKTGIIGYGYWGPNLVRNFMQIEGAEVAWCADRRPERLAALRKLYPGVRPTTEAEEIFADPSVDAVAIATPVSSHFDLAMRALRAGKHVLVEKPMTSTSEQAARLIEEAERRGLVLMVDHTFVYSSAVQKIRELVTQPEFGEVYYYDSVRINLGLFQHDVDVIWDLAVHDLSIMDYILPRPPYAVSATGMSHVAGEREDIAYLTLFFEGPLIAHLHVSWLAPVKVRRTLIGGSRQMIVYDDLEPSEKVKTYDKGITVTNNGDSRYQMLIGYRTGDMRAPHLDVTEALRTEAQHFTRCVRGHERPLTDGAAGLRVIRILEAAGASLARRGAPVELPEVRTAAGVL